MRKRKTREKRKIKIKTQHVVRKGPINTDLTGCHFFLRQSYN